VFDIETFMGLVPAHRWGEMMNSLE